MKQPASARRNLRLLTVALHGGNPALNLAGLAALPGFDLIGNASDCDDGLRQAIMHCPDVIILSWSAATPELLRAIVNLREKSDSPLVAVVADPAELPADFTPPHDGVVIVATDQNHDGLAENLGLLLSSRECEKT
ncbi:MAG: hypothetical protein IPL99_21665 [Candidatus Competibacteraceae bacterium]|nr:hypothetical protein [Candidatus Competibacteraceae bacterium]